MYCPKCGQQVSNDLRYCSRCGLPLSLVADIVRSDALVTLDSTSRAGQVSPRRQGMRTGAKIMLFCIVLAPLFFGISFIVDSGAYPLIPGMLLLAAISTVLYLLAFGDHVASVGEQPRLYRSGQSSSKLEIARPGVAPVRGLDTGKVTTSELTNPGSVTEQTTQLFDRQEI